MDVMIYLPDNSGYQFHIEDGKTATTTKFFQTMVNMLNLPQHIARKCFALWLKSPLLDVQLKPQHVPFRMVKQWGTLIARFSKADDIMKYKDEPALVFKRNAFFTKEEEIKIDDPRILDILLMEARSNIHQGIYPCDREDIEQLGVLLCMMNKHQLDSDGNDHEKFKHTIQEVVPEHMTRQRKSFLRRQKSIEDQVYNSYKSASKEEIENAHLEFMKICWQLPYYGSVIFEGEVKNSHNRMLASWFLNSAIMHVHVAINTSGVWIIDKEKKHVLIGLSYGEFNWEVATTQTDEEEEAIPSLFIEFDEQNASKLLQIMSKQATMMNSMIETCNNLMQAEHKRILSGNGTTEEGAACSVETTEKEHPVVNSKRVRPLFDRQNSVTCGRPGRLCLTSIAEKAPGNSDSHTKLSDSEHGDHEPLSPGSCHSSRSLSRSIFKRLSAKNKLEATKEETNELL